MTERDITRGGGEDSETVAEACLRMANDRCYDMTPVVRSVLRLAAAEIALATTAPEGPSVGMSEANALNPLPEGNRATVVVPRERLDRWFEVCAMNGLTMIADEMETLSAPPSVVGASEPVAGCSPEFARLVLPSVYRALDCVVSPAGGIAQERLEYVASILEQARDATAQPLEAENRSLREALEEAVRLLSRIVRVYGDIQDGAGNTPTEIRKAERFIARQALSRFPEQEGGE